MKKLITFICVFVIFFSNFYGNLYIYSAYTNNGENVGESSQSGINSDQLISLLKNKGFQKKGLLYLLQIRKITKEDIEKALKGTKKEKIEFIKKLLGNGLTTSQLDHLQNNGGFRLKGKSLLRKFSYKPIQINSGEFLEEISGKPGIYKINFVDIKPGVTAGKVQNTFVGQANLPKKLILEEGFSYNINSNSLEKNLSKTTNLTNELNLLKQKGINIGDFKISDPQLDILPDRIRYSKNIKIDFSNEEEFNNIKTYLSDYLDPQKIKQVQKGFDNKVKESMKNFKSIENIDFNNNLIQACLEKAKDKNQKGTDCNNLDYSKLQKTLIIEDNIDISLIPLTVEDIEKGNILINQDPATINITRSKILEKFSLLKEIQLVNNPMLGQIEINGPIPKHNMNKEDYCDIYYKGELDKANINGNISEVESKINNCKELQGEVNKVTTAKYNQTLLNGFTIGEQKSYNWATKISVDTYLFGEIDVFEFDFSFYYLYGIGIRIPIKIEGTIQDSMVHNYAIEGETPETNYESKIRVNTFNGDEVFYKEIGLENKHIFDGQELVLKFSSGIKFHVRTPITSHIRYEIKLTSLLVEQIKDGLKSIGINDTEIAEFKAKNIIDLSKDFTPPFAGDNILRLLNLESNPIVLFSVYGIDLLGKIGLKVDIDGRITSKCEGINSEGGCPAGDTSSDIDVAITESSININSDSSRVHFNTRNYYTGNGNAVYNGENAINDSLGYYSHFGINLNDFRYHPILILTLYALVGVGIPDIPYIGDLVVWSPEIDIYTIKFSSDDLYLGTHSGINGNFDMTNKNKIYSTSSTLQEISYLGIEKIGVEKYITPRSPIKIEPLSNTTNGNAIFYRKDGTYPQCEVNGNTKVYFSNSILWPEAIDDLVNEKTFNMKAIACDLFSPNDPRAKKTYKHNVSVKTKNYYHKPIINNMIISNCLDPMNPNDKTYRNYVSYYNYGLDYFNYSKNLLLQEELDNLEFQMPLSNMIQQSFIKITARPENTEYFIKYSFENKNILDDYKVELKPINMDGMEFLPNFKNTAIINEDPNDICNSNSRTTYNGEIFVAGDDYAVTNLINEELEGGDISDKIVYYNKDKVLKAVKCIKKDDNSYFQSLEAIVDIKIVDMVSNTCSSSSSPIDQEGWRVNLNSKMKKDIINPIFNNQNIYNEVINESYR